MIRTPKGANELDLETPLRCSVNWDTQQMILTLPYNMSAFRLEKNGVNDPLPRFEVTGFSFEKMPAEKALYKLTKEAGIKYCTNPLSIFFGTVFFTENTVLYRIPSRS